MNLELNPLNRWLIEARYRLSGKTSQESKFLASTTNTNPSLRIREAKLLMNEALVKIGCALVFCAASFATKEPDFLIPAIALFAASLGSNKEADRQTAIAATTIQQ